MDIETNKRELLQALEVCLQSADKLGLALVSIHICHAIDLFCAEDGLNDTLENQN